MKYEEMSDFEINKKVGLILGLEVDKHKQDTYVTMSAQFEVSDAAIFFNDDDWHDYCGNPSDAWSLLLSLVNDGCTIVIENNSFNGVDLNGKSISRKIAELYLSFNSN